MPNRIHIAIFCLAFILLIFDGCKRGNTVESSIRKMTTRAISVDTCRMFRLTRHDINSYQSPSKYPFRLITYIDTTECGPCTMESMYKWNEYLNYERDGIIRIIFIFQTNKTILPSLIDSYHVSGLQHEIYLDTASIFERKNPKIPKEYRYHTILTNDKNQVILVGNPTSNKRIKNLLLERIE